MVNDINLIEFLNYEKDSYHLVDVRNEAAYNHGYIPGAILYEEDQFEDLVQDFDPAKKVVVYCAKGLVSKALAKRFQEAGFDTYHLIEGYSGWLMHSLDHQSSHTKDIERSITKKFKKSLFSKFAKGINEYDLLQPGDKVAICISGGKDSMVMAKLFQELKRHNKFPFDLTFLMMDPGYNDYNRHIIEKNADLLGIPLTIFETDIFDTVYHIDKNPCYLCARMRRGHLYSKAKELGCNKIALGHHYDDVIETILMGMLYGAQVQTMMPKLYSKNFEGMELIRPMYLVREEAIKKWCQYNQLQFIQCACRFTNTCSTQGSSAETGSKRMEVKHLIQSMKERNPYVESNIFRSVENVNLDTVISYKKNQKKHHFLDDYES